MKKIFRHNMLKWSFQMMVISFLMVTISCDDFLDVDEDNDNPTVAPNDQIFSNINLNMGLLADFGAYGGEVLQVYTHQFVVREDADQYGTRPNDILINNDWETVFLTLTDIQTLISQATIENNLVFIGYAQLAKAYMISSAVDIWGDVPFLEASQLSDGIIAPNFDNQIEIYQMVLDMIDEAKINIQSGEGSSPGESDLFYGGDNDQWIRFANSFKLKLYNQIRLSDLFTANRAEFDDLVADTNNFFINNEDDFEYTHTETRAPRDERNNLYRNTYGGTFASTYSSPWFYEILLGVNPNIHTGSKDPRIPYYFVNQLEDDSFPVDQGIAPDPNADYWDTETGFFSIRFGSIGPDRDSAVENDVTFPGIFPCGGLYDENIGYALRDSNTYLGTGAVPKRIFTYDEFLYVQAELIQVGLLSGYGTASDKLREAINASFAKVDKVVDESGTTQTVPDLVGADATNEFIDNIIAEFDVADTEKQLEIIMTQKWVATFADPLDQYTDYRRTEYPVLADPNSTTNEYQLDNGDDFPIDDSFTTLNVGYPLSLFWPQIELNINPNAPAQKVPSEYKIFWDN